MVDQDNNDDCRVEQTAERGFVLVFQRLSGGHGRYNTD